MERLVILDFTTGEVDIYPIEYKQEPDIDTLLGELGHRANDCNWMYSSGKITIHSQILTDKIKNYERNKKRNCYSLYCI